MFDYIYQIVSISCLSRRNMAVCGDVYEIQNSGSCVQSYPATAQQIDQQLSVF
ncbi:MAG: hypothetical protein ACI93H_001774 [Psychromonas sp.]|jgi:hypothetical protein